MIRLQKFVLVFLVLVYTIPLAIAQDSKKPIIKVTYTSSPISQYDLKEEDLEGTTTKASMYEVLHGITDYYSLYVNLVDRSSVYVLDSTVQERPRGWEDSDMKVSLADTVLFTLKTPQRETLKHEWIMNQTFFTEGKVGDIEWELTNETKTINGLSCLKAITKKNGYPMLTVWYTKDIPVSNGPSIYQGLPGLVVWAEDFFRTINIFKIEYTDNVEEFDKIYKTKHQEFIGQKEIGKHFEREPILLIKKGDLARSLYQHSHGKPYRKDI